MKIIRSAPRLGDVSPDVLVLKQTLSQFGFNPGELNDVFDEDLKAGLLDFQDDYMLASSGEAGPLTLSQLRIMVDPHPRLENSHLLGAAQDLHTHPIPGRRQNRHLHPVLREKLDHALFSGGLPVSFQKKNIPDMICDVARAFATLAIVERGDNHGTDVGFIQSIIGSYTPNGNGDSWCMSTVQCEAALVEDFMQRESLMPAGENCVDVFTKATRIKGLTTTTPEPGTFGVGQHGIHSTGHTWTTLAINKNGSLHTFEGNRNNRAMIGDRDARKTGDLHTLGFIRMFP